MAPALFDFLQTDADAKDRLETSLQSIDTEQLIEMINENFERLPPELLPGKWVRAILELVLYFTGHWPAAFAQRQHALGT